LASFILGLPSMADSPEKSIQDILAACRKADGGSGEGKPAAAETPAAGGEKAESAAAAKPAAAKPAPAGADPKSMSVADILAAARAGKGGAASAEPAKPAAAKPAAGAAADAGGKKASEMTVAEIMAAARAAKAAGAAPEAPKSAAKVELKPKAKAEAKPVAPAAAAEAGPKDTQSILAAARKAVKPGPISKAEAAAQGKEPVPAKRGAPPMPEKPAYAQPRPAASVNQERRGVLAATAAVMGSLFGSYLAVGFGSLATVSGLWGLGLARFMFPNILTEPPSRFKVGFPADFAPEAVTEKFKAQYGVWIVNTEYEGQRMITALRTVCTHLGCTPNWLESEQKFKCPCHGSGFYKDGINFEGPAPRPLERYAIRVADDGQIEVDKSKMFQQEKGEWEEPASFVIA
jgi:cytochrome b6-f complex iron-sulfur subunit